MSTPQQEAFEASRTVIVKIGTNVLTTDADRLDIPRIECIADQMNRYNDEEIAAKVCGAIKAGGVEMRAFIDARAEIVDLQIEKSNLKKELESIKAEFASLKNINTQMFAIVNEIANVESDSVIETKKNVFSKVESKNEKIKNLATILSTLKK